MDLVIEEQSVKQMISSGRADQLNGRQTAQPSIHLMVNQKRSRKPELVRVVQELQLCWDFPAQTSVTFTWKCQNVADPSCLVSTAQPGAGVMLCGIFSLLTLGPFSTNLA